MALPQKSDSAKPDESTGLSAGSVVASYELIRKIGKGAMGAVWEARHVALGKKVAIKTLHPNFASSEEWVARFVREGRAAVSIRHPNAVDVSDVGVDKGIPYLVMAMLEGESLAAKLHRDGAMTPKEAANIGVPILAALSAAHEEGIVHRDIKTENIFLARGRDGQIVPTLLDFGVSKLAADTANLTATSSFVGTPYYMSPEQANDSKSVDARTDIYSMGVVLYECLAGKKPFVATTLIGLVRMICDAQCEPLGKVKPTLPPELVGVVHAGMRVEREDRFQTAKQFATALLPFAGSAVRTTLGPSLGQGGASDPPPAFPKNNLPPIVSGKADPMLRTMSRTIANIPDAPDDDLKLSTVNTVRPKKSRRSLFVGVSVVGLLTIVAVVWALTRGGGEESPQETPQPTREPTPAHAAPVTPILNTNPAPTQPTPTVVEAPAAPIVETETQDVQNRAKVPATRSQTPRRVRRTTEPAPARTTPNAFRVPL